jgi:hypothetical protein
VFEIPVESEKAREKFINEIYDKVTLHNDIWPDINLQTTDDTLDRYLKEDVPSEQDFVCLHYVNKNNVETCPQIQLLIGNQPCRALTDTGCQCSIISEELYNKFKARGLHSLELPTQNVVLKSAFTSRTKRVRTQPSSDAIAGVMGKYIRPYEGPYLIRKVISPSTVEVCDKNGKFKGQYNLKSIQVYKEVNDMF